MGLLEKDVRAVWLASPMSARLETAAEEEILKRDMTRLARLQVASECGGTARLEAKKWVCWQKGIRTQSDIHFGHVRSLRHLQGDIFPTILQSPSNKPCSSSESHAYRINCLTFHADRNRFPKTQGQQLFSYLLYLISSHERLILTARCVGRKAPDRSDPS